LRRIIVVPCWLALLALWIPVVHAHPVPHVDTRWDSLAPGLDLGFFKGPWPTPAGDTTIVILRMDPQHWRPQFLCLSQAQDANGLTAKEWCERDDLVAVTNAGMFATDHRTHVGYMKSDGHLNCPTVNQYQSAVAFDPTDAGESPAGIFDLDVVDIHAVIRDYRSVAQNLRLIKKPGINRWSPQERMWSEAALGEDSAGRLLFIFVRSPFSMHDLSRILLSLPINLVCAQHLEGGPEAQLYIRYGETEYDFIGSYETGFWESDGNHHAWPIPNALAIGPRR